MDKQAIRDIVKQARKQNRSVLLEHEGIKILESLGIGIPESLFVKKGDDVPKELLDKIPGDQVVVKVVSPEIMHKSDVGGVVFVDKEYDSVNSAVSKMNDTFSNKDVTGYLVVQNVEYDKAFGTELLFGLRFLEDFGPIVSVGPGGIYTEFLSKIIEDGQDLGIISPSLSSRSHIQKILKNVAIVNLNTKTMRSKPPKIQMDRILDVLEGLCEFALEFCREDLISDFELNPMVVCDGKLIALDCLIKLNPEKEYSDLADLRPLSKLKSLLEPKSIGIVGVSSSRNPGHIILDNILKSGFSKDHIHVIKPKDDTILGCKCYPDIQSLPGQCDLMIVAIAAAFVPEFISNVIEMKKAESIIVIPGGLEEKQGTEDLVARMNQAIVQSRHSDWKGPLINGGNCLGVKSVPGKFNTLFIPEYKLPLPKGNLSPVAIISQSGAFAISKINKLKGVNPKYIITMGNQMDLTVADYLTYLKDDESIKLFAIYVEGFKKGDGLRFMKACQEITNSGRKVIFYCTGRTEEGSKASQSHTASIAGNYTVTRELARNTGVLLADTQEDFEDLTRTFSCLIHKEVKGTNLAALSNAGFECVGFADNISSFALPKFSEQTTLKLEEAFKASGIDTIVDVHNPIDLTPMANDDAYDNVIKTALSDENMHCGVFGIVPLTPALNTLSVNTGHREDLSRESSIGPRLVKIMNESEKPFVVVVEGGDLYLPLIQYLEEHGIVTFRTADRALKILNTYCRFNMK